MEIDELPKKKWYNVSFKGVIGAFGGTARFVWFIIVVITMAAFWYDFWYWNLSSSDYGYSADTSTSEEYSYEGCDVAGITLHGDLYTYALETDPETGEALDEASSEDIVYLIEKADEEPDVKAILLEIDSYGGSPVAAEEVANALKKAEKPTVVQIRDAGDSAAYWAATGADTIFASELSDVGVIGVTMSYIDESKFNEKEGYTYNSLSTGRYKDMYDPEKPLTAEERALAMRDLEIIHDAFVRVVAENRKMDINKVRALADGSAMLGTMALQNGLIDKIGGFNEVENYLKELTKTDKDPVICW
jgi:signal peptide peptidase SppA